jgi:hypothetical protein
MCRERPEGREERRGVIPKMIRGRNPRALRWPTEVPYKFYL